MKDIVKTLNGMNCFIALGVGGIIIFKCNLDPSGIKEVGPKTQDRVQRQVPSNT